MLKLDRRMFVEVGLTLFSVLTAVNAIKVVTPQKKIEVARGAKLPLPCQYSSNVAERTGFNVEWYKRPEPGQKTDGMIDVIMYFYGGILKSGDQYVDRVNFTGDVEKDDCSILIYKSRMTDSGFYDVEVRNPFDLDGDRDAGIDVVVLVPPSKPICTIEGKAELGQDVKLTCHSEEGSPKPTYTWESFNIQNQIRQMPVKSSVEPDGLSLKNLTAATSGYFLCTARNKIQSAVCNITLAVTYPSMDIGFYGGIIGGIIAALIILGIIVYCCCCRNGKEPEDYEMDDPRDREEYEEENREEYEENNEEKIPGRDSANREYHGAYDDALSGNSDKNSPRSAVRMPLVPPNKPPYAPENHDV
ncbi:cell surface A33 antigen-like [Scyliorhinus torazame]|uniref:cell surface A33 antigen-like n=1 Tax=Scyliorhinus torazame TaxID=75743 RepID=UPI003B5BEEE2